MGSAQTATKGGQKGRKFGRSKRGTSMVVYNAVRRDLINAKKAQERHQKTLKTHQEKVWVITPHGTARELRRADIKAFKADRLTKQLAAKDRGVL